MAIRPVFQISKNKDVDVNIIDYEFKWHSGFAKSQKQKSIEELHKSYLSDNKEDKILEISTSSTNELGVKLSAFNLMIKKQNNKEICSVECLFQSCKRFENGGPYKDIIAKSSIEAKKDARLKNSGNLLSFIYKNEEWPLEPKTIFYDYIYMNALNQHEKLKSEIVKYDAFTDIEFNPKKSINCQARSAALYVWLFRNNMIDKVLKSRESYMEFFCDSLGNDETQLKIDM